MLGTHDTCHPGLTLGHILLAIVTVTSLQMAGVTSWRAETEISRCNLGPRHLDPSLSDRIRAGDRFIIRDAAITLTPGSGPDGSGRLCLISTQG